MTALKQSDTVSIISKIMTEIDTENCLYNSYWAGRDLCWKCRQIETNQTVKQCEECCVGSPLYLQVVNPANKMSLHYGNATTSVPVTQTVWATVNLAGYSCHISPDAIVPTVVGACINTNISLIFFAI